MKLTVAWILLATAEAFTSHSVVVRPRTSPRHALLDDWQQNLPSSKIVDAVQAQPKVIAADVAAQAGVSLSEAQQGLTALAAVSRANLAVTDDGDLLYEFPDDLNQVLQQNSAKYRSLQLWRQVWPSLFWVLRVSFGVTLLVSLVAIFSTIFFISSSSSSSDDDRRRSDSRGGGGFGGGVNFFWGPSPLDFFYYRPYGYYGSYYASQRPPEMGFFESVFSYIFGDGNPNVNLDQERLQKAATVIRSNGGAVTAEQLAPFCDDLPDQPSGSSYVNEAFVLPIVSSLGGQPKVTEDGDIVYVFPDLQATATSSVSTLAKPSRDAWILERAGLSPEASSRDIQRLLMYNGIEARGAVERRDLIELVEQALPEATPSELALLDDPSVLQEREWKFSLASDFNKVLAGGLGVVNLGGALYLGNLLGQYAAYGVRLPEGFGVVQGLYPFLLVYAVLFNIIPLARNFWIQRENAKIRARNEKRRKFQRALEASLQSGTVGTKIAAARKLKSQLKQLDQEKIVYDTRQTADDLQQEKQQDLLDDFDQRLL